MQRRAAGDHVDLFDLRRVERQALKDDTALVDARADRAAQRLRLLHDLLEHEVLIAALFCRRDLPVDVVVFLFDGLLHRVVDLNAVAREDGDLAVFHVDHVARVLHERCHVGGKEILALAEAEQQRRVLARGIEPVRLVGADDAEGVCALDAVQHHVDRIRDGVRLRQAEAVFEQLRHDLAVGLRDEFHALFLKEGANFEIVFNDPVVNQRNLAVLAQMGMGIDVVRLAMGGPAGVPDAERAGQERAMLRFFFEIGKTSFAFFHMQHAVRRDADARGVIAAVFQTAKAVQQNGRRLFAADISNDSTHNKKAS